VTRARSFGLALFTAALALGSSGCCRIISLLATPPEDEGDVPDAPPNTPNPAAQKGDVDLGTAVAPPTAANAPPVRYRFQAKPLSPSLYITGLALAPEERADVKHSLDVFAKSVGYHATTGDRFEWKPPKSCAGDMRCVFDALVVRNYDDVAQLGARFAARAKAAHLNAMQAAELVVAFTQAIHYEVPKESPFGILPPAMVVSDRRGDCDSKSLLTMMLLDTLGIASVMIESDAHAHAMVGIALPAQGTTVDYDGRRYAFTEVTAKGWPIGQIKPDLLRPNDWHVVPVRLRPSGHAPPDVSSTATAQPAVTTRPRPKPQAPPAPRKP
jgi:hypothetical protein